VCYVQCVVRCLSRVVGRMVYVFCRTRDSFVIGFGRVLFSAALCLYIVVEHVCLGQDRFVVSVVGVCFGCVCVTRVCPRHVMSPLEMGVVVCAVLCLRIVVTGVCVDFIMIVFVHCSIPMGYVGIGGVLGRWVCETTRRLGLFGFKNPVCVRIRPLGIGN